MPPYVPSSKLVRALLTTQDRDLGGPGERGTEIKVQKLSDLQPMKGLTVKPRGPGSQRRLKIISQWSSPFAEPSGLILSLLFLPFLSLFLFLSLSLPSAMTSSPVGPGLGCNGVGGTPSLNSVFHCWG